MKRKILPLVIIPLLALQGCSCQQRLERLHPDVAVAAAMLTLLFLWGIAREVRLIKNRKTM